MIEFTSFKVEPGQSGISHTAIYHHNGEERICRIEAPFELTEEYVRGYILKNRQNGNNN